MNFKYEILMILHEEEEVQYLKVISVLTAVWSLRKVGWNKVQRNQGTSFPS